MKNEKIIKTYVISKANLDEDKRIFRATITDQTVDRDKEVILAKGMNIKEFKKNGIILFNHDKNMPIGKSIDIKRVGDALVMTGKLALEGTISEADKIWQLIKQGILKSMSIGFMGTEFRMPTKEDIKDFGKEVIRVISKSQLLEVSVVSVPANQNALITAFKDMDIDPKSMLGVSYIEEKCEDIQEDYIQEETIEDQIDEEIKTLNIEMKEETREKMVEDIKESKVDMKDILFYFSEEIKEQIRKDRGELF